jgi:formate dehydrogenase alpha subunit
MSQSLVICPFCGCGCGFYLEEDQGIPVGVTPSRSHPVSRGTLCAKGWRAYEFIRHPQRLSAPTIRDHGIVRTAPWDDALDRVASTLVETRDRYGGDALGFLASAKASNEENYVFMKMARALFKTNNIDHCARL